MSRGCGGQTHGRRLRRAWRLVQPSPALVFPGSGRQQVGHIQLQACVPHGKRGAAGPDVQVKNSNLVAHAALCKPAHLSSVTVYCGCSSPAGGLLMISTNWPPQLQADRERGRGQ